jgi:hypothetical protein
MRVPETPPAQRPHLTPLGRGSRSRYSYTLHPKSFRKGEVIEFLAQMPTDTMIFLIMAVLGLAATLIVLRRQT